MSFAKQAAKSGIWLSAFRFVTQVFSWLITIAVAKILVPEDYGLMAMASMLTGYIAMISEMGLGSAIIQKEKVTDSELSSLFWFSMAIGTVFAACSWGLAYPTSWLFEEPRVIPVTQFISVMFLIGALITVPNSILTREARFKEIGAIQLIAIVGSSLSMLLMAKAGFGVWTLIGGNFIHRCLMALLIFAVTRWHPLFHFDANEVKLLLQFGVTVASARSLYYLFQKSDKFIVGKMFNAQFLGYYSLAIQLASMPTEKIVSTIQQVAYPVFARCQNDLRSFGDIYLKLVKYISLIVSPLFVGGMYLGDEIILLCLGEKWTPITFLFRCFCIVQLIESISTINGVVHNALGRPKWFMYFTMWNLSFMPLSIALAAQYGFDRLVIPWVTVYPVISMCGVWLTIRRLQIPILAFLMNVFRPLLASGVMIFGIWVGQFVMATPKGIQTVSPITLGQELMIGVLCYGIYLTIFESSAILAIRNLWSKP